jgi:hypothetical protein
MPARRTPESSPRPVGGARPTRSAAGALLRLVVDEAVLAADTASLPVFNVTLENQIRPEDDIDILRSSLPVAAFSCPPISPGFHGDYLREQSSPR